MSKPNQNDLTFQKEVPQSQQPTLDQQPQAQAPPIYQYQGQQPIYEGNQQPSYQGGQQQKQFNYVSPPVIIEAGETTIHHHDCEHHGPGVNHGVHCLLCFCTGILWLPFWIVACATDGEVCGCNC